MIARHWRGWTTPDNADAYELFLKPEVLPKVAARINRDGIGSPWPPPQLGRMN